MGGSFDDGRQIGTQAQKLAAAGEKLVRVVGEKAEMADSHETFGDDMEQEASDKFLDWECSGLEPIFVFSIAVSESNLAIVGREDPVVGQSDTVDVAAEVLEQVLGRAERLFGVDVPTLLL